ncbi:MAG: hypothetical protein RML12_10455 [Xanthomonadales bacterium]|nr:hypothetical protein [Xanthomonadales bacterium]
MILRALPLALLLPLAPAAAQSGLLVNGGFEQLQGGQAVGWPGLGPANLSSTVVRSGQRAAAIERDQPGDGPSWQQGWLPTVAGRSYKLIGHLRCDRFEGEGWGFPDLSITHADWSTERIAPERILAACGDGQWHGFALRFTARPGGTRVSFGVFGPKARVRLYFDDLAVIEAPAANQPPSVSATVGPLAGTAPLAVSVAAQAADPDGAVEAVFWDMGDGSLLEAAAGDPRLPQPRTAPDHAPRLRRRRRGRGARVERSRSRIRRRPRSRISRARARRRDLRRRA